MTISTSPLIRQIAGISLGVLIALALGAGGTLMMKQAGKTLDARFLESANPTTPQHATERSAGLDGDLQAIHRSCALQAERVHLSAAQLDAIRDHSMLPGETSVARSAVYVECLARSRPARFCRTADKSHLVGAVREYFDVMTRIRAAWGAETGGGAGGRGIAPSPPSASPNPKFQAVLNDIGVDSIGELSSGASRTQIDGGVRGNALSLPSASPSASLLAALRDLAADGYVVASDFGRFAGIGVPPAIADTLRSVAAKAGACR
jgi:hypothetical protein